MDGVSSKTIELLSSGLKNMLFFIFLSTQISTVQQRIIENCKSKLSQFHVIDLQANLLKKVKRNTSLIKILKVCSFTTLINSPINIINSTVNIINSTH